MPKRPFPFPRDPVIEAYKKDIDRTLIRENLKLSVEERFERLMELQRLAEELQRAGCEARKKRLIYVKRAVGRPKDMEAIAELETILEERLGTEGLAEDTTE